MPPSKTWPLIAEAEEVHQRRALVERVEALQNMHASRLRAVVEEFRSRLGKLVCRTRPAPQRGLRASERIGRRLRLFP